jgi:hypothetical protein
LGYTHYGNWEEREKNNSVEPSYLRAYLQSKKVFNCSIKKKLLQKLLNFTASNGSNISTNEIEFFIFASLWVKAKRKCWRTNELSNRLEELGQ